MFKKGVTLIELMVVIIVLGILSAIAIPNVKNIKTKATLSSALENKANVQKGLDRYFLEKQTFPTTVQPTAEKPQQIDFTKLTPPYLLKSPQDTDKFYYWVDVFGTVWMSDIDSPTNVTTSGSGTTTVTFDEIANATSYQVGYIDQNAAFRVVSEINAGNNYTWKNSGSKSNFTSTQVSGRNVLQTTLTDDLTGKLVIVNAVSKNGLATVPVGIGYSGSLLQNQINPKGVKQLVAGGYMTTVLLNDGTVKAWGRNTDGELGNNSTVNSVTPVAVSGLSNVKQIASGGGHTLALLDDGTVKAWGSNSYGQLGDGTTTNRLIPVTVTGLTNVVQVDANSSFSIALLNDGTVKMWGDNTNGQLGNGTTSTVGTSSPVTVTGLSNVVQVSAGGSFALALLNDDTVKSWGNNIKGQLGDGTTTARLTPVTATQFNNVKQIVGALNSTLAVLNDGTVVGCGADNLGQLGNGLTTPTNLTIVAAIGLSDVKQLAKAGNSGIALLNDGTIKTWGYNAYGQLGNGTTTNITVPTTIAFPSTLAQISSGNFGYHTEVLLNDGTIESFGLNQFGELGTNTNYGATNANPSPIQITLP